MGKWGFITLISNLCVLTVSYNEKGVLLMDVNASSGQNSVNEARPSSSHTWDGSPAQA